MRTSSLKNLKLPSIAANPEKKTYFKSIEEMGNGLRSNLLNKFSDEAVPQREGWAGEQTNDRNGREGSPY